MDFVADVSAATLGYLHGNTRGAYAARKLIRKYRMPPITPQRTPTRGRKRRASLPALPAFPKFAKYALTTTPRAVRKTNLPTGATSYNSVRTVGSSLRLPRVTKKEKQPTVKLRKEVKVSHNFREKTKKVIAEKQVKGIYITDQVEHMQVGINGNTQDWASYPNNDHAELTNQGQLFGLTRVVAVASRCWNEKDPARAPQIGDAQMYGTTTDNTELTNYKFDVRKQWWEFQLKNNTHFSLNVRIHQCGHKRFGNYDNPLTTLNEGIVFDHTNGDTISSIAESNTVLNNRTTLIKPELVGQFKNLYSTKTIAVLLEPGQEYSFTVQGPAMVYDAKKFFSQNTASDAEPIYNEKQKNDISLMWQVTTDMAGSFSTVKPIRNAYGMPTIPFAAGEQATHALIIRSQYHCKLLMPQQVGFKNEAIPGGGTVQTLGLRKDIKVLDDFKVRTDDLFANTGRIDPVEPVQN